MVNAGVHKALGLNNCCRCYVLYMSITCLKKWAKAALIAVLPVFLVSLPVEMVSADTVLGVIESEDFGSVAFGPSNDFAYAVRTTSDISSLVKIRTSDLQVVSTTSLLSNFQGVLVVDSAGAFAYVSSTGTNEIAKINLTTSVVTVMRATALSEGITDFVIDSSGTNGYVDGRVFNSSSGRQAFYDTFIVKMDLASGAVARTLQAESYSLYGLALDESRNRGCVVDNESGGLQSFSLSSLSWVGQGCAYNAGLNPAYVALDSGKNFGYFTDAASKSVTKFNLSTLETVKTISVPWAPDRIYINPASTFAYVVGGEGPDDNKLIKISLATFAIVELVQVGNVPSSFAISPNGRIGIVRPVTGELYKVDLSVNAPQSITFPTMSSKLTGVKTVNLNATASSGLSVTYRSTSPEVCTVSGVVASLLNEGACVITASQSGSSLWEAAVDVSTQFNVFLSPLSSESGISISSGKPYTNSKNVTLEIKWPEYASSVRLSNDGGFGTAVTQTKKLSSSIAWVLDDSVRGIYTKVVYARFVGEGIDTTKTYSDDIILDTTAPNIASSTASGISGSVEIALTATDDITGVDKIEVKNGFTTVMKDYDSKVSVTEKELGLAVSAAGVHKADTSSIEVRVSDRAGNWSAYQTLSVYRAGVSSVITPKVTRTKSATAKSVALYAKLTVALTSKVSLKVLSSSAKYCRVSGTTLKGLKAGSCKVTVTVTPKKGRATFKTVTLKVSK